MVSTAFSLYTKTMTMYSSSGTFASKNTTDAQIATLSNLVSFYFPNIKTVVYYQKNDWLEGNYDSQTIKK